MRDYTDHELVRALVVVRHKVGQQGAEAKAKKDYYFDAVANPKSEDGMFGDPDGRKNQKELTRWTRLEREYELLTVRLRRMHENAKRVAAKNPEAKVPLASHGEKFTHCALVSYMYDEACPIYGTSEENAIEKLAKFIGETYKEDDAMDQDAYANATTAQDKVDAWFGEDMCNEHKNMTWGIEQLP